MLLIKIIFKDLKIILSDKKTLAIIILMPIILMTILGFALKGSFSSGEETDNDKVNIAVVKKYDSTTDSKLFLSTLSMKYFKSQIGDETIKDMENSGD